jgi:nitroreductase
MIDIFQKRRAVRRYSQKPLNKKQIKQILTAAFYAPSGYDKHPLYFIVVCDQEMKQKLARVNQWARYSKNAATIIVVCADEKKNSVWLEDASIATGYMWLKCAELGLGACWIHIHDSPRPNRGESEEYVKRLLKIPAKFRVICFLAVGYPLKKPVPHSVSEYLANKVYHEKWGKK